MLKFGVCLGFLNVDGSVRAGKAIGLYYEGVVNKERLKKEIIPDVEKLFNAKGKGSFPIIIYSYYSEYRSSKLGIDILIGKPSPRFRPKRPKIGTKRYDWFINNDKEIFKIKDSQVVKSGK